MKNQIAILLIIILSTSILYIAALTNPVSGETAEIRVVNPETGDKNFIFDAASTSIGTKFNITVWLYEVNDLFSHQVKLVVNDTLLNITNAWIPNWNETYVFYGLTTFPVGPVFYDDDGDGSYEGVLIGDTIMGTGNFTGNGLLAIFELEILYTPNATKFEGKVASKLNIDNEDTFLLDSSLEDIPVIRTDGYYQCSYPPPKADFTFSPQEPYINQTIVFDASISSASQFFNISQYVWDFGDGNVTTTTNQTITHKYSQEGNYTVSLTVIDQGNLNDTVSKSIVVIPLGGSFIDINVDKHEVMTNETVCIYGRIYPNKTGVEVKIFYRLNRTGEDWSELAVVQTNATSQYEYYWTPTQAGVYLLYSSWPGDEETEGANSMDNPASVIVKQTSQITINIGPRTVEVFSQVEINGTISPTPEGNSTVTIKYRLLGSAESWSFLANVTAVNGFYSYIWNATKLTQNFTDTFEFKALWYGDGIITLGSESTTERLNVTKIQSITFSVDKTIVKVGEQVHLSGKVWPLAGSTYVQINYTVNGSPSRMLLGLFTRPNSTDGSFSLTWDAGLIGTVWKSGNFTLIAIYPYPTEGLYSELSKFYHGISQQVSLTVVKNSSSLIIEVEPQRLVLGETVTINGTLYPVRSGEEIEIYARLSETGKLWLINRTTTDANGEFICFWAPNQTGTYEIYAFWAGNEAYQEASSNIEYVTVEQPFTIYTYLPQIAIAVGVIIAIVVITIIIRRRKS